VSERRDDVEALFTAPPEEFVAARNALAKALRADGQRDLARQVAALRRPTVAEWALNMVAHDHPDDVSALLAAAEHLRAVQAGTVEGHGGDLRSALTALREASTAVHRRADAVLAGAERDAAAQARALAAHLNDVAVNPEMAAQLREGHLGSSEVDEVDPFEGLEPAPVRPAKQAKAAEHGPGERPRAEKAAAARRERLQRELSTAQAALARAEEACAAAAARVASAQAALADHDRAQA
jgi:hypothetical protein